MRQSSGINERLTEEAHENEAMRLSLYGPPVRSELMKYLTGPSMASVLIDQAKRQLAHNATYNQEVPREFNEQAALIRSLVQQDM
jgi:hypothetical protein